MTYEIMTLGVFIVALLGAYFLARILTGVARAWALRHNVVSLVTHRSSHSVPTARLGGVGLGLGFFLAAALFLTVLWLIPHDHASLGFSPRLVLWAGLGWGLMFLVGLLDDLYDLPALAKLGLMVLAALAPTLGGRLVLNAATYIYLPSLVSFALDLALTLLWILFFTNAYNFMDGMDGFAGSFARSASWFLFTILLVAGFRSGMIGSLRAEACLLPILALACWGFLHWNRPPARVFMGDGGSLSTGYLLAVFAVVGYRGSFGLKLPLASSLTVLMPFIFDVVLTLLRRARRGENLLQAHREHLYQRLLRTGLAHAEVLRLNRWLFRVCGLLALAGAWPESPLGRWAGLAGALGLMLAYWARTLRRERQAQPAA